MNEKIVEMQAEFKKAAEAYLNGEMSIQELKHFSAPLGIYPQRDDRFMIRLRGAGGKFSVRKLKTVLRVMEKFNIPFTHLSTRQTLQLHDVDAAELSNVFDFLNKEGFYFYGGGGDTFRNVLINTASGSAVNEVFDVRPYAEAAEQWIFSYRKAFELPRKLKIGFNSETSDEIGVEYQDLGFSAAVNDDGEKGFVVYCGGGMGRETRKGFRIADFLKCDHMLPCIKAVIDMFYELGDRNNRSKARLRFLAEKLGREHFLEEFRKYFEKAETFFSSCFQKKIMNNEDSILPGMEYRSEFLEIPVHDTENEGFAFWQKTTLLPSKYQNYYSVRFFVKYGKIDVEFLKKFLKLLEFIKVDSVYVSQSQDFFIKGIHSRSLEGIYLYLIHEMQKYDLVFSSFKGHVLSCIGAGICRVGMISSPDIADMLAERLDEYFGNFSDKKAEFILNSLPEITFSGCHNGCSGHPVRKKGVYLAKRKVNGKIICGGFLRSETDTDDGNNCYKDFMQTDELIEHILTEIL